MIQLVYPAELRYIFIL